MSKNNNYFLICKSKNIFMYLFLKNKSFLRRLIFLHTKLIKLVGSNYFRQQILPMFWELPLGEFWVHNILCIGP